LMKKENIFGSKWQKRLILKESVNENLDTQKTEAPSVLAQQTEKPYRYKIKSTDLKLLAECDEKKKKQEPALIRIKNIKRRTLYNPTENSSSTSRQKKIFLFTVSMLCVAFAAFALLFVFSPQFRYAVMETGEMKALAHAKKEKNWNDAKRQMKAIVEGAAKADKAASVQVWLMTEYGGALMTHEEYPEALTIFDKCVKLSTPAPDWYTYSVMMKGLCEHQMSLVNPLFKPNIDEVKSAVKISEGLQEKYRTGSLMAILGNLYGDIGDWKDANQYFDDADKTFQNMGGGMDWKRREVLDDRWMNQIRMLVVELKKLPKPPLTTPVQSGTELLDAQATELLSTKKFEQLDQLFERAARSRVQTRSGREAFDDALINFTSVDNFQNHAWAHQLDKIQYYAAHSPRSVTPYLLLASFYNNVAMNENETDSRWQSPDAEKEQARVQLNLAKKQLSIGAEQLQKALALGTPPPQWFSLAQKNILTMGSRNSERVFDSLTDIAKSFYPNYVPIYLNKIQYLQHTHPSDYETWLPYLTKVADSLGGDEGDKLYARAAKAFEEEHQDLEVKVPFSEERIKRGEDLLDKQFSLKTKI